MADPAAPLELAQSPADRGDARFVADRGLSPQLLLRLSADQEEQPRDEPASPETAQGSLDGQ